MSIKPALMLCLTALIGVSGCVTTYDLPLPEAGNPALATAGLESKGQPAAGVIAPLSGATPTLMAAPAAATMPTLAAPAIASVPTVAVPAAPAEANPSAFIASQYHMAVGDRIRVEVFGESDLTTEALIDASGTINLPLISRVLAAGQTPQNLEANVANALIKGDFLKRPRVQVSVLQFRPVFISGAVKNAGAFAFQDGLTVEKALVLSGGLNATASSSRIYLIRDQRGRQRVSLQTPLFPGDTVIAEDGLF